MSSYKNLLIAVLLVLLVGGGLAIWNAEQKAPEEPAQTAPATQGPEIVGHNVSFTVTEGEVKKWTITGDKAIYNESRTEAHMTTVQGDFFDANGKPVMHFTAPTGEYTSRNNAVVLSGGVLAKSTAENGGELQAPTMSWNAKSGMVTATGGIKLTSGQGVSTAQTCRFSMDFSKVEMQGGVTSVISSP